ncbi:unnamed protein product [Lathyrus sativus]|nr:unnamed protein product [Lathyrus sativus]
MATTPTNDKNNNGSYPPPQNPPPGGYPVDVPYPYAAPPPPSSYPTTTAFYQQPTTTFTYHQPSTRVKSILCGFIFVITVILGITILIGYFNLKPRAPEFRVDSASLTSFNINASGLTAKWDFTLTVSNPNKKIDFSYEAIAAGVFYDGENDLGLLASTRLAPFRQPTQSKTSFQVEFAVVNEFLDNRVANGIAGGRVRGVVNFALAVNAVIKLSGWLHPGNHKFKVACEPLNFAISSLDNNNATGQLLRGVTCD